MLRLQVSLKFQEEASISSPKHPITQIRPPPCQFDVSYILDIFNHKVISFLFWVHSHENKWIHYKTHILQLDHNFCIHTYDYYLLILFFTTCFDAIFGFCNYLPQNGQNISQEFFNSSCVSLLQFILYMNKTDSKLILFLVEYSWFLLKHFTTG